MPGRCARSAGITCVSLIGRGLGVASVPRWHWAGDRRWRGQAAGWMNQRFAVLQESLPWLERADDAVTDFCKVGAAQFTHRFRLSRKFVLCRGPEPPVMCWREVTVTYGFGGPRAERLAELIAVLEDDG